MILFTTSSGMLEYVLVGKAKGGSGMTFSTFGEWTYRTFVLVFLGFVLKTLFNQYLLKVLDAIWKNISEAIGVLLVYFAKVTFLGGTFDATVFNAAFTVILACIAYILSKNASKKKSDICDELDPRTYPELAT